MRRMKRVVLICMLFASISLVGCGKFDLLPEPVNIEKEGLPVEEQSMLVEKKVSFQAGTFLYVDKDDFINRFNAISKYKIDTVEKLNEDNHLIFKLNSKDDVLTGVYLTAENNPVQNKLSNVKLAYYGNSVLQDKEHTVFEDLLRAVYMGLHETDGSLLVFDEAMSFDGKGHEIKSFTHDDYDVYSERNSDSLLVAFHPKGTFTSYESFNSLGQNSPSSTK